MTVDLSLGKSMSMHWIPTNLGGFQNLYRRVGKVWEKKFNGRLWKKRRLLQGTHL